MHPMLRQRIRVSLENEKDIGQEVLELEYTFYAKIHDFADLEKAFKKEEHEQWILPIGDENAPVRARLRAVDGRDFLLTTKSKRDGQPGVIEITEVIHQAMFRQLTKVATDGYKKTRYIFRVPNSDRIWELDVFQNQQGDKHVWAKLDLEVKSVEDKIPELPIQFDDLILVNGPRWDKAQEDFVDNLWDKEWAKIAA